MRMRVTTRTAEVMPLDTRAVEVEINKEEPITTTKKHTKISYNCPLICLNIKLYLLGKMSHICEHTYVIQNCCI